MGCYRYSSHQSIIKFVNFEPIYYVIVSLNQKNYFLLKKIVICCKGIIKCETKINIFLFVYENFIEELKRKKEEGDR